MSIQDKLNEKCDKFLNDNEFVENIDSKSIYRDGFKAGAEEAIKLMKEDFGNECNEGYLDAIGDLKAAYSLRIKE